VPEEKAMITSRKSSANSKALDGASSKAVFLDLNRSEGDYNRRPLSEFTAPVTPCSTI
jgi:hypothetical protein